MVYKSSDVILLNSNRLCIVIAEKNGILARKPSYSIKHVHNMTPTIFYPFYFLIQKQLHLVKKKENYESNHVYII